MGKKVLKLFLETMLRAIVIILAIGIVIMLALLIKTSRSNSQLKKDKETTERSEIETEAEDGDDPTFMGDDYVASEDGDGDEELSGTSDSTSAKILVINATGTSGVAGSWKSTLEGMGYYFVEVGNYLPGVLGTSMICVSGDYNGSDLEANFSSPQMSTVDSLTASDYDATVSDYDIVIVVGTADIK
jgi:hypothetical protein